MIDYSLCVGCGACSETFPELFEIRDDRAWVISQAAFDMGRHRAAVDVCIYGAISIQGRTREESIFPAAPTSRGRSGRRSK